MFLRRAALLCLVLLLGAGALYFLFARDGSRAPALERPPARETQAEARSGLQLESETVRSAAVEAPPVPAALPQPPEDLRAEGARRGWQLPFGKGWWLDTLINPAGVDLDPAAIEALQERVLSLGDQLLAQKLKRKQRLDAYCQERIAAGLAFPDPQGEEPLPEGKQHVIVTTHSLDAPNRFWRVDVGPGDDAELDAFDRQIASTWCAAVEELRRRFAGPRR